MAAVVAMHGLTGHSADDRRPWVPQTETAEWVARQADQRDVGKDGSFRLKMRLFDRQQRVREPELTIKTLRAASGVSEAAAIGDRMLIRFTFPTTSKERRSSSGSTGMGKMSVRKLELIQSIWTLSDVRMTDGNAKTHTDLSLTNVRYNLGLKESDFTRRELEGK